MTSRKRLMLFAVILLVVGLPFAALHLVAKPDDAPISPMQHIVAATANYFGPWGVAIVRLVDFPNAGMRSFRWTISVGMTLFGGLMLALGVCVKSRPWQLLIAVGWTVFACIWVAVGFRQIADGLL